MTTKLAAQDPARNAALIGVLIAADVVNEDGQQLTDFIPQNRDALDFANVSRWQLEQMLAAAFEAGRAAR